MWLPLLWLVACVDDPSQGTFVGNPGMVQLAAAPSESFGSPSGFADVSSVDTVACDGSVGARSEAGQRLVFDGWELAGDEPVLVPAGAWCGVALELDLELVVTAERPEGDEVRVTIRPGPVRITLEGPELKVDEKVLGLQLAGPGWLAPILEALEGADGSVDLATEAPDVLEQLAESLERRSALFVEVEQLSAAQDAENAPPGNEPTAVWAGDDREDLTAAGTEPTEPTVTVPAPVLLPGLDAQVQRGRGVPAVQMGSDGEGVLVAEDAELGLFALTTDDPLGEIQLPSPAGREPTLATGLNGEVVLAWVEGGVQVANLFVDPNGVVAVSSDPSDATPALALRSGAPLVAWRSGDALVWSGVEDAAQPAVLAERVVFGPALADHDDGRLVFAWVEAIPQPAAGQTLQALQVATFLPDGSWQLATLDHDVVGVTELTVDTDAAGTAVAWVESRGAHVARLGVTGAELHRVPVPAGTLSVDAALAGDLLVVATTDGQLATLQLHDLATGAALGEPLAGPFGFTVRVDVGDDGRQLAWGGTADSVAWVQTVFVAP